VTLDPTAKRGRRLVELRIDGEPVDPEETYSVATFRRPGDPERDLETAGSRFRDVEVDDDTIPVDVIVEYLEEHSPVDYEVMGLVETAEDGGRVQNTPADGPYPFIQPGVDYAAGEAYCETSMIPRRNTFPDDGRVIERARRRRERDRSDERHTRYGQVRYDGQQHHCGTTSGEDRRRRTVHAHRRASRRQLRGLARARRGERVV